MLAGIAREARFFTRDRGACMWVLLAFSLSVLAVIFGVAEVRDQRATINQLAQHDAADRSHALEGQVEWGSAAYYAFHLTYSEPSEFAFAAIGQRDSSAWKHRIRMLALEGQIHEADTRNADFGLVGRFDFAFLAASVAPLLLILLLHDLRASERSAGRHDLLAATASSTLQLWLPRALVRIFALLLALLLPLWIGALIEGSPATVILYASLVVAGSLLIWWLIVEPVSRIDASPSILLTLLVGVWLTLAIIVPAISKAAIETMIPAPDGGEILMLQREAVNDAWDLPKEQTMEPFVAEHPEWREHASFEGSWAWKWYYAFQQVGDQRARPLVEQYRNARLKRDQLAGWAGLVSPPSLVERAFEALADTNTASVIAYEDDVRAFHASLREFYYPLMFPELEYDPKKLQDLPSFMPR